MNSVYFQIIHIFCNLYLRNKILQIQHLPVETPWLLLCELHIYIFHNIVLPCIYLFNLPFTHFNNFILVYTTLRIFLTINCESMLIVFYQFIYFSVKHSFNLEEYSLSQCTLDKVSQLVWLRVMTIHSWEERGFSLFAGGQPTAQ